MDGVNLRTDTFSLDRKMKYIEMHPKGDTYLVIFVKLLLIAKDMNDNGFIRFSCKKREEIQQLSEAIGKKKKDVSAALSLFEECDLIERFEGAIFVKSLGKYTAENEIERGKRLTRERVARHRAKKKEEELSEKCNVTSDKKALQCNVTPPAPPSPSSSPPLSSPPLPSLNNPIYYPPYNPPHNASHILHTPIHSFVQSRACEREEEDAILLTCYDPEKINEATESERASMLKYAKERQQRTLYNGVVMLSQAEVESLLDIISVDEFNRCLRIVTDEELKGHHYKNKTHFQAILDMAMEDRAI